MSLQYCIMLKEVCPLLTSIKKNIKQYIRQRIHKNVLIHIGKCGGSSLRIALKESVSVKITGLVHVTKPLVLKQNYYIVARDPITRCISAYNWRYKLVVTDGTQKNRFEGEFEILKKYQTLNGIAEKLYNVAGQLDSSVATEFEKIHHLHERIAFYLESFLKDCPPHYIKGVFMQESLNHDIEKYLGVPSNKVANKKLNKRKEGDYLTPTGKKNLVRYLESDYSCLFYLCSLGHIENKTMSKIVENTLSN